ncbi:hypothetical protein R5M92_05960 [Halomonas sp. Bachu 37]|uniref:hypothetical protein n=1 Tax=Halomonas kashgarensis TaxID=3084920 RepID=UPI0032165C50
MNAFTPLLTDGGVSLKKRQFKIAEMLHSAGQECILSYIALQQERFGSGPFA